MEKITFKVGDYVSILPLEKTDDAIHNMNGSIKDIYDPAEDDDYDSDDYDESDIIITIDLDAQSLDRIDENYMLNELEFGTKEELPIICCKPYQIELSSRRDTDEMREKALERVFELVSNYTFVGEDDDDDFIDDDEPNIYYDGFEKSIYFQGLNELEKRHTDFAMSNFIDYLFRYEGAYFPAATVRQIENTCTYWMVGKTTAQDDFFEAMPMILVAFFKYMGSIGEMKNAESAAKAIFDKKREILKKAQNPKNWHPAKSMMMGAFANGLDLQDDDAVGNFLEGKFTMTTPVYDFPSFGSSAALPLLEDNPFKHLGRNDRIDVTYKDGTIKQYVKFKTVEADLKAGKCDLF